VRPAYDLGVAPLAVELLVLGLVYPVDDVPCHLVTVVGDHPKLWLEPGCVYELKVLLLGPLPASPVVLEGLVGGVEHLPVVLGRHRTDLEALGDGQVVDGLG
jgi:hypothetical protein